MTGPAGFQDFTGNSGFTSDGDGANANLDITMSDESARNLWDVQAAIQQIAADFQTAVRAASDFNSYLISIRETGQTIKMPSLGMEGGEGGNLPYSGRVDTNSVPAGIQSELGMASRIGEMMDNQEGMGGGSIAAARSASGRPVDVGGFVSQMSNAGWMASMSGQHGSAQATHDAYRQAYDFAQNNPYDYRVATASYQGQTGTPHAYAAQSLVSQGLPAAQQFLRGGGIGGIAGMLGRLGTYGAVAYAGYQLVNAGLETYAQSRSLAISTNNSQNGVGWGFRQRLGQAGMALSPFVSQEEAAQIYSSAVDQGWASRSGGLEAGSFGQALNFMYNGAKDYNMDPAMSAQLLQTNAIGAGESVTALSQQLMSLKETLDGTGISMDAANSTFTSFTGMLIASGATGPTSAMVAGGALAAYKDNPYLRNGRGAEIVQQTLGSQQTQNVLAALTGTLPGATLAGEGHLGASTAELDRLTKRFVDQVMSMHSMDEPEKAAMLVQLYNGTFGTSITEQDALNMMATYTSNPNALSQGMQDYREKQKIHFEHRSGGDRYKGAVSDRLHEQGWTGYINPFNYIFPLSTTVTQSGGWEDSQHSYGSYSPEVQNLLDNSANKDNVTILDENGNVVAKGADAVSRWFNDSSNQNKFTASGSKYTINDNGASWNANNIGGAANTGDTANPGNDKNTVYIQLSTEAKRYFATDKSQVQLSDGKN